MKNFMRLVASEAEQYIIQKKLVEFSKGCEVTKKIMSTLAHKEIISFIIDADSEVMKS